MDKIKNFIDLFSIREKIFLSIIFFGAFVVSIVEAISLGSIAGYIVVLAEPSLILDKLPDSFAIKKFISDLDQNTFIIYATVLLVCIFIFKNLFILFYNYFSMRVERNILVNVSKKLLNSYIDQPYLFHVNNNPTILVNSILAETHRAVAFIFTYLTLLRETIILLILFSSTILISYKLTILITISLGITSVLFISSIKNSLKKLGIRSTKFGEVRLKNLTEIFGIIKIIKIFNARDYFTKKFEKSHLDKIATENTLRIVTLIPRSFLEIFGVITIASTTFYYLYYDYNIQTIIPTLTLLAIIMVRAIPAFGAININLSVLQYHRQSLANVLQEFNKYGNLKNKINEQVTKNHLEINSISLNEVIFKYQGSEDTALKNISLTIKKGEFVSIFGNSGSGKSTLVDIILGLFSPTSGKMKINESSDLSLVGDFENKIGYVPQDIYLNDDTIENNIAIGVEEKNIDKDKILTLIDDLKLHTIISQSKEGIKTYIGNRGIKLSGGQRQRLGIARALYKNPEILILDEATNALDIETEKNIMEILFKQKKNRITILINHRIDMLKNCDNIFVLQKGKIVDRGKLTNLSKVNHDNPA